MIDAMFRPVGKLVYADIVFACSGRVRDDVATGWLVLFSGIVDCQLASVTKKALPRHIWNPFVREMATVPRCSIRQIHGRHRVRSISRPPYKEIDFIT